MSAPVTRDLAEIVRACEVVEAELAFQTSRLAAVDPSRSGSNPDHIQRMKEEYAAGSRIVAKLRRYQESRLAKQQENAEDADPEPSWDVFPEMAPVAPSGIDEEGRASAHVD
jgi:hypothetical protein